MNSFFPTQLTQDTRPAQWHEGVEIRVQHTDYNLDLLQRELTRSGQQYTIQNSAPLVLQRFFTGEIDLDTELSKRFNGAPLLSRIRINPAKTTDLPRGTTSMATQDDHAAVTVDVNRINGVLELSFTLGAMLSLHFELSTLAAVDRRRWMDLMRREQGIAFLWSHARWERDYMIFVVRKYHIRAYAFSPRGYEAAVRMTPDVLDTFMDWLEGYWL